MYTVIVDDAVKSDLTKLWGAAGQAGLREAHRAVTALNEQLKTAPHEESESREGNERIMFDLPVGALYVVHEAISRVNVLAIWYVRRRGKV